MAARPFAKRAGSSLRMEDEDLGRRMVIDKDVSVSVPGEGNEQHEEQRQDRDRPPAEVRGSIFAGGHLASGLPPSKSMEAYRFAAFRGLISGRDRRQKPHFFQRKPTRAMT